MNDGWHVTEKVISEEGTTITYRKHGTYFIQSRKRHIPHANGRGTWDHTFYWVCKVPDEVDSDEIQDVKECGSLKDAKAYADKLNAGGDE